MLCASKYVGASQNGGNFDHFRVWEKHRINFGLMMMMMMLGI